MSQLTKTLIVLLTVATFFLCASVVTYVSSSTDWKYEYEDQQTQLQAAERRAEQAEKEHQSARDQFDQDSTRLNGQISELKNELTKVKDDLASAEREKSRLLQEASDWKAITRDFRETKDKQGELLKNTLAELDKARAEQIKLKKDLDETSNSLIEKTAVIETLQNRLKALEEENSELQTRLSKPLRPLGKEPAPAAAVTRPPAAAEPAAPVRNIDLKALVTAVDMKNSMASVSVGSVDGVREGMRFHVTRGDEFICDILIISVDTEESVGVLELVQQQPMIGDNASTNL